MLHAGKGYACLVLNLVRMLCAGVSTAAFNAGAYDFFALGNTTAPLEELEPGAAISSDLGEEGVMANNFDNSLGEDCASEGALPRA